MPPVSFWSQKHGENVFPEYWRDFGALPNCLPPSTDRIQIFHGRKVGRVRLFKKQHGHQSHQTVYSAVRGMTMSQNQDVLFKS